MLRNPRRLPLPEGQGYARNRQNRRGNYRHVCVAILATHGYDRAYAVDPFELGIRRLCEHSRLQYLGLYSARDVDDLASFRTEEARSGARAFARSLLR